MAYTAHSDYSSADPPTFVIVGNEDAIAPPAITSAEGWIFEAIRFWEASVRNPR
jgi:hypothetical protein